MTKRKPLYIDKCYPGEFPECGCHYTTDDDGIHFCPMHKAASDLLAACKKLVAGLDRFDGPTLAEEEEAKAAIGKAEKEPT